MTERERLIELLNESTDKNGIYLDKLADYLLANGVSVPPFNVGDTVYQRDTAGRIYESKIKSIIYDTDGVAFDKRAIGETIFLTREEAEKALREEQNHD